MFYHLILSLISLIFFSYSGAHALEAKVTLVNWPVVAVANAQEFAPSEYQVKAAFLYQFLNFVEWPEDSGLKGEPEISICVLGEDPFGPALAAIEGETVRGKKVKVKGVGNIKGMKGCNILFISGSERANMQEILQFAEYSAILTVGDMEGFAESGGIIGFVTKENKVRFKINLKSAREAGIKISSKLLRVGYIIGNE